MGVNAADATEGDATEEFELHGAAVDALAFTVALTPPVSLRSATVAEALRRRTAKAPAGYASSASGSADAPENFLLTINELRELVDSLRPAEWEVPLVVRGIEDGSIDGWSVGDLLAHLCAIEAYFAASLGGPAWEPPAGAENDHRAMTLPTVARLRGARAEVRHAEWMQGFRQVVVLVGRSARINSRPRNDFIRCGCPCMSS